MMHESLYKKYHIPFCKQIVLYDGVCSLCNLFVKWIIAYDKNNHFLLAHLQSEFAKEILGANSQKTNNTYNTVVLVSLSHYETNSNAALEILHHLGWTGRMLSKLKILPEGFRDAIYIFVSRNRYFLFGKKKKCKLALNMKEKFIY